MLGFCQNGLFRQKIDFSNSVLTVISSNGSTANCNKYPNKAKITVLLALLLIVFNEDEADVLGRR